MKIVPASDSSLLIVLGDSISLETHERVMAFFHAARELADPRIRNIHPAYTTVLIDFDPLRLSHDEATALAQRLTEESQAAARKPARKPQLVVIPVCYDAEFGPDLDDVAKHAGLSHEEVVRLHSTKSYTVHFLGFSPGFAYLSGLPDVLHIPRLATPRKHVPAGSVAIAGNQAGVYPVDSPGGWRLIGRTPVQMFSPKASDPTGLHPGERVQFQPIDRETFCRMVAGNAAEGRR